MANNKGKVTLESVVVSNKSVANDMLRSVAFVPHWPCFLSVASMATLEKCILTSKVMTFSATLEKVLLKSESVAFYLRPHFLLV